MAYLTPFFGAGTHTGQIVDIKEPGQPDGLGGYSFFVTIFARFEGKLGDTSEVYNFQLRLYDNDPDSPSGPAAVVGNIAGDTFFDLAATYVVMGADTMQINFNNDGTSSLLEIRRTPEDPTATSMTWTGTVDRSFNLVPKG